jgi:hypothetical protein
METGFRDAEFAEQLCRLDREAEQSRTASLEVSELVVTGSREWLSATEWVATSTLKANG